MPSSDGRALDFGQGKMDTLLVRVGEGAKGILSSSRTSFQRSTYSLLKLEAERYMNNLGVG